MQTIKRKLDSFDDLVFIVDLEVYGRTLTDVEDVIFSVKADPAGADILLKLRSTGGITTIGESVFTAYVQWDYDEYTGFVVGTTYYAGLFCKFIGLV